MMDHKRIRTLALAAAFGIAGPAFAQADTAAGQAFFDKNCAACHQAGGKGQAGLAPPLAGSLGPLFAQDEGRLYLLQVMVHGLSGKIVSQGQVFNLAMPPQGTFSDAELAEAARYLASLNASNASFTPADVARARGTAATHKQMRDVRDRLLK